MKHHLKFSKDAKPARAERHASAGGGEFELIERICARLPLSRRVILGPGDDAAIIAARSGRQLVTIDSIVEGVHFNLAWGTPEQLGERALAINLSDIAAMGGAPSACVINLGIRPGLEVRFFERMYSGLAAAARRTGVDVVGGNVTKASELTITITLFGDAPRTPLRRDAARSGDRIYVTGTLGDAALGWRIAAGKIPARGLVRKYLVDRYLAPEPRLKAGSRLARIAPTPAAIDISDGLMQDLGHVLERSGAGAEIDARTIPVSSAYRVLMGDDLALALGGGEDYELLFCMRPGRSDRDLARMLGVRVTNIGAIIRKPARGPRVHIHGGGRMPEFSGWDHLRVSRS